VLINSYTDQEGRSSCFCSIGVVVTNNSCYYRGADKSLGRPGRNQVSVSVGMAWSWLLIRANKGVLISLLADQEGNKLVFL